MKLFTDQQYRGLLILLPIAIVLVAIAVALELLPDAEQVEVADLPAEQEVVDDVVEVVAEEVVFKEFDPNKSSYEELREAGLPKDVAVGVVRWRSYGKVYRVKEDLALVSGMTDSLYAVLKPFIVIDPSVAAKPKEYERKELAREVLYTRREFSEKALEFDHVPVTSAIYNASSGFPDLEAEMQKALADPEQLWKITYEWSLFAASHKGDPTLLRSRWKNPQILYERLSDLQREPIIFTAAKDFNPQRKFYISDDELDWVVRAGPVDYRLDVYSYFANHTDAKDREHFLSHYHGEYSGSSGGNNDLSYTYKRLRFSHGSILEPYAQIELSWRKVLKRVENLLQNNSFLYESDRAEMAEYELKKLARTIHSFFRGAPDIFQRPYNADETFEYWENIKSIQNLLKSPAGVAEIQAMMQPLWEWTQEDSAEYKSRKEAMEAMQAYRDGTYSVFGKPSTQYQLPKVQEPVPDPLEKAKQLINEYCQEVFEQDADFSDLSHVDLAMGATSDSEHTIEIHADLTAFRLVYRVNGETVHKLECKDLQELNEYLANLEFDQMISYAEERFLAEPEDVLDTVDPAKIREKLAQRGIVDGELVDPEALDNDPFIQQVVADAEAMEQEQPAVLAPPKAKPKREHITFDTGRREW